MIERIATQQHLIPTGDQWRVLQEQATILVQSGFMPSHIKTPVQAIAIAVKGRELGIPICYALSNIAVIQGKPVCGAEVLAALVYRDHGDDALEVVASDGTRCTVQYKRRGWKAPREYTFTIEDARQAKLAGKPTWQEYPAAMLRARCISAVARMAFPDSIGGMYLPEELGADVSVNEHGEVVVTALPAAADPAPPGDREAAPSRSPVGSPPASGTPAAPASLAQSSAAERPTSQPTPSTGSAGAQRRGGVPLSPVEAEAWAQEGNPIRQDGPSARESAPAAGRGPRGVVRSADEFWRAAGELLSCNPGKTATECARHFEQAVPEYKLAYGLEWDNVYALLDAKIREGVPIPHTVAAAEPVSAAVQHLRADLGPEAAG